MARVVRAAERVADLVARSRKLPSSPERLVILDQLIDNYSTLAPDGAGVAQSVRKAFLLTLEDTPEILREEKVAGFLAEHIEPEDFANLRWQTPQAVVAYCKLLYSFRFHNDMMAEHLRSLERGLLRYALQQYEHRGQYEKMFQLLKLAPTSPAMSDAELQRLRNRAYLYEMRRVQRNRRLLYAYLVIQAVLITLVFPLVFIRVESGIEQQAVTGLVLRADAADAEVRSFTYLDGLYWSVVTAASIGYGDITPLTNVGKMLALVLGIIGVITIAVLAGLIMEHISQRTID